MNIVQNGSLKAQTNGKIANTTHPIHKPIQTTVIRTRGKVSKEFALADGFAWQSEEITQASQAGVKLFLECGFGKGESLYQLTQKYPHWLFTGVELYAKGLENLALQAGVKNIKNLRLVFGDIRDFFTTLLEKKHKVDLISFPFPDPWPKRRHHKRRLLDEKFIYQLQKLVKPQGIVHIATDWQDYANRIAAILESNPHFTVLAKKDVRVSQVPKRCNSQFAAKALREGRVITDFYAVLQIQ